MKILFVLLAVGLALSACGRRGAPTPFGPPADVTYPRVYPAN